MAASPSLPPPALLLLFLTLPLAPSAAAPNPYCSNQPYWNPDGTIADTKNTGDNWSSLNRLSAFVAGPCLGVSGIGTAQTFLKTVIVIDRAAAENGYLFLDGRPQDRAYAQELDLLTRRQRPLDVITNTFCSSGQHGPDGTLFSIGGDWSPDYAGSGEFSIRGFAPCANGKCGFDILTRLARSRWYPTSALLGDGRMIIVGGSNRGVGLNREATNVPYIEYFTPATKTGSAAIEVQFLKDTLPYNLYPFVHLLPSGKVFIFADHSWMLWDTGNNKVVPGNYPDVDAKDENGARIAFNYPISGTSALFPLYPGNNYEAEVMVCGGGGVNAIRMKGNATATDPFYPTSNRCFRIFPEAAKPAWQEERMVLPRVDGVAVLLADNNLLIIGGTQQGFAGLGKVAHKAALTPDIFDTRNHKWYTRGLVTSKIPRGYHSSALLLHDGTVFVSGSNPNSKIEQGAFDFPIEFRTEFFLPPYSMGGKVRPSLVRAPPESSYGRQILVSFTYPRGRYRRVEVVLAQPGFSTHGANHGMRNVGLRVAGIGRRAGTLTVAAVIPDNRNVLPPTWYWLFVLVDGVPNREGHHIFIK